MINLKYRVECAVNRVRDLFANFNLTSCSVSLTGTVTKTRKKEFLRRYVQCLPISTPIAQF